LRRNCLQQQVIEGKIKVGIEVKGRPGRRRRKLLDDLKERRRYSLIIKPTRCTNFSNLFFGMKLYMFRTVPLSIIRFLFTVHTAMLHVIQFCKQLESRNKTELHHDPVRKLSAKLYDIYHCCVNIEKNPDDGQRNSPKHVEFHSKE
jgi:hypothetical protein